ncbi:MAG: DMT family transporter [Kiloniellales bacterium]
MAWLFVITAGLIEIVFAMSLKASDGFMRPWPALLCVVSGLVSVVMLSAGLKSLPIGTGYAVWVGIGAAGVALAGIVLLGESASLARLSFMGLIVLGVIGLKFVES